MSNRKRGVRTLRRMLRWALGGVVFATFITWATYAAWNREHRAVTLDANRLGQRVPDLTLLDATTGQPVRLSDFRTKRALVVAFNGIDCPLGNLALHNLNALAAEYHFKGVAFLAVHSSPFETADEIAEHAKQYQVPFPVLKDEETRLADLLRVERTCEVVVLDPSRRVRYHGAIDDQYDYQVRKVAPSRPYLRDALNAVLANRNVEVPYTQVAGCPIPRPKAKRTLLKGSGTTRPVVEIEREAVTYCKDVAPILQAKCQPCHRPGEAGLISLLSYQDAKRWAFSIEEVVFEGRMPPWHAHPDFGRFANDRSLTDAERSTLRAWVEHGAPEGNPNDLPPPRSFPIGWSLGTPDVVLKVQKPYLVPAEGVLEYIHVSVPTDFPEDVWVRGVEVRPSARSVVHHIIVFVDDGQESGRALQELPCLGGYAPGDLPFSYPEGVAKRIPTGSELVFEIHYTPIGRQVIDQPRIGLYLADGPVSHVARTIGIKNENIVIPPGDSHHQVRASWTVPQDAHLLNLMPHMHKRGKAFRYTATYPDGRREVLLEVPVFDFNWQTLYQFAEPKPMPAGTKIDCLAVFDNSTANPYNPDPTATVRWGDQSWDEMMMGYVEYFEDSPGAAMGKKKVSGKGAKIAKKNQEKY